MAGEFGLSFAPFAGKPGYGNEGPSGTVSNPVQEAIQILSLRRPTVVGASAPVAGSLMGNPTGMPDLSALLQTLMRQFGGQFKVPQLPREMAPTGSNVQSGAFPPIQAPAPPARTVTSPNFGFDQPGKESGGSGAMMPTSPAPAFSPFEPRDRRV